MRKKMLLLALALAALAGSLSTPRAAEAGGTHACRIGCRSCVCDASGFPIACTNVYC